MSQQKLNIFVIIFIISTVKVCWSQYNLPSKTVILENNISVCHVYKSNLRVEDSDGKKLKRESINKTKQLLYSYFFSETGQIDSVYRYYEDTLKYEKQLFSFGAKGELREIRTIKPNKELRAHSILEELPGQQQTLKRYSENVLTSFVKINNEGVLVESSYYQCFTPKRVYLQTVWDLKTKTKSEFVYENDTLKRKESYQWIVENDVATHFLYTKLTINNLIKDTLIEQTKYAVDKEGSVLSPNKGLFTDPFSSFNYNSWFEKFSGLKHPFQSKMRENCLISNSGYKEIIGFDGRTLISEFTMRYEVRN